jgi:hypothetical protein
MMVDRFSLFLIFDLVESRTLNGQRFSKAQSRTCNYMLEEMGTDFAASPAFHYSFLVCHCCGLGRSVS